MRNIIFVLLFSPLLLWAQQEVSYPGLQSTFDFYLRQTGLTNHHFALRLFTPDPQLFADHQKWGTDGFGVVTNQKQIFIYGNTEQAFQNGIYDVLQRKFGFDYYQSSAVQIPAQLPKNFAFDKYESIPAFSYREVFYGETRRSGFADWHKLTSGESSFTFENHPGWGLWVHTLHRLLPPEQYFDAHPEYYALRNGVRLKDQVCLSNSEVLDIVCSNLSKEIAKNPKAKYWSVSQMDNYNYCECGQCQHTDSLEQSHAGSMLQFVNKVALRFPDQIISTLAYQYTRSAPVRTKPEKNVNIMLCTIEENRAKSLRGTSFENDLKNWAALTHNILIWDYVINFSHMVMPFPNWPTLQENMLMFKEYGVQMLFEQGYNAPSSEMQPLRAYLLSKWSWDPTLDANLLLKNFTDYFYGPAGAIVREVLQTQVKELQMSGKALTLYEPPITHIGGYLNPASLKWALQMYERAKKLPGITSAQIERLDMAAQSIRYALLEIGKSPLAGPDWYFNDNQDFYQKMLKDFVWMATQNGPKLLHETRLSPTEYYDNTLKFWKEAKVAHLAKGQPIKYLSLPSNNYKDGLTIKDTSSWTQTSSINDGLRSTLEYQRGWQGWQGQDAAFEIALDKPYIIDSVRIHFLANNQSWIMGPSYIEAKGKNVSNQVFDIRKDNSFVNLAQMNGAYPLTLQEFPNMPIQTFKLIIGNPGPLPKWRGVAGDGWLFIDEIEVYGHD
ncbi:MAG: hypothetical protein RL511_1296 [Bacteroidota bacterium]